MESRIFKYQMFKSIVLYTMMINLMDLEIKECTQKIRQFGQELTIRSQIKTQLSELLSSLQTCSSEYKIAIEFTLQFDFYNNHRL